MSNLFVYSFEQLVRDVQAITPFPFETALCRDEIKDLINLALRRAFSKYEKVFETNVYSSSNPLPEAQAIVKVIPNLNVGAYPNMVNFGYSLISPFWRGKLWQYESFKTSSLYQNRIEWIFTPERVLVIRYAVPCKVFYIKDPKYLKIEDLSEMYYFWVVRYASSLIKQKEAYIVTESTISSIPLEFNYNEMRAKAEEDLTNLEVELEDMFFGCFPNKT